MTLWNHQHTKNSSFLVVDDRVSVWLYFGEVTRRETRRRATPAMVGVKPPQCPPDQTPPNERANRFIRPNSDATIPAFVVERSN